MLIFQLAVNVVDENALNGDSQMAGDLARIIIWLSVECMATGQEMRRLCDGN